MSDINTTDTDTAGDNGDTAPLPDELAMLKQRAKLMGITFSGNIGLEALRAKVNARATGEPDPVDTDTSNEANPFDEVSQVSPAEETRAQIRARLQKECLQLVRLRITNLDPKKKDLPGEIITIGNEFIGNIKKFVPYGEVTDNGYHVPKIIYDELKGRKFLNIRVTKKNGREHVEQNWAQEFSLDVLPQLTEHEIARLAATQAAAGGLA